MAENFAVVLVLGFAVFGAIFVIGSADGDFFTTSSEEVDTVFVDKSYGTLGEANPDDTEKEFGDFTVGEARGEVRTYRNEKATISDRLLGGENIVFRYNATQPRKGNVSFEVLGREGKGEVYVKVNGEKIFSEALIATGTPDIVVPAERLSNGINRFEIGVDRSSFFDSSTYTIEEVEARVNDRKYHDYEETFQIFEHELKDHKRSPLTFVVSESVPTSPLTISVNDNTIYSEDIVRSDQEVEVREADLHTGSNEITFSTERPAEYSIENAILTMIYTGSTETQNVVLDFNLSGSQLNYAEEDDTASYIEFDYQNLMPSARQVSVELNNFTRTLVPENGENSIELPEDTLQEDNSFAFRTSGKYELNRLRVYSEGGE